MRHGTAPGRDVDVGRGARAAAGRSAQAIGARPRLAWWVAAMGAAGMLAAPLPAVGTAGSPLRAADAMDGLRAAAHEEAVLESDQTTVMAGAAITVRGAEFGDEESYAFKLIGVFDEFDLGTFKSDAEGRLALELPIGADVRPGAYQITAFASDGDIVARLDLTVTEAVAFPTESDGHGDAGRARGRAEATAEEMPIERSRSGTEWGVIGIVIGTAGGLGFGLLRRAAA